MTFYKLWLFTISIGAAILSIPRGRNVDNMMFLRTLTMPLKYIFGIQIVVKGKENLRTKKPFVLVLNHQTSLDILVMMEILPRRCVPIAKKEILYMGTFGLACWLAGVIFIDRKRREESISTLTEVAHSLYKDNVSGEESNEELLENRNVNQNNCTWRSSRPNVFSLLQLRVLIFPEGTRNHGGSMLPFKRGAFQLAVKAQVPIIPVVFSSYNNFYNQKEKKFTPGKMIIQILPEVETLGLGPDDVPKLTEQVRDSMLSAYQGISGMTNGASH
ncbi:1-acyl-sn-glycerol-3-phosphate acyltransferase alpha [Lonchura striata]|uniref:1-acylglycerol-3-phosphate O-acyltransferase n=1 Tax=Lonchura striata TaxID=40157 RepID=A0A218UGC2_9PASE|nr:1-acyl-sn-glycerol-3-phosphate acyltransferase alpha [Lonchura striata domestica]